MRSTLLATVLLLGTALGCKSEPRNGFVQAAEACSHDSEMSCVRPIFNVRSLRASQSYFRDVLGFKVDWDHGDPPTFGSVSRGHGVIFLCQGCQGNPGAWAMMFAEDVDRLYKEFSARKAVIRMPPTDMPWGLREMHVSDPDGNVMRMAAHKH
jgi:catechol 2,3-dioxygenase-like lactoylglutathione lyase family enzyme